MSYEPVPSPSETAVQTETANWHFLSHIVIRRTSFPFEWLNQLTMPTTAKLAQEWLANQQALDEQIHHLLRHTFPQAVRQAWQDGNRPRLRAYSRLRHKVGHRTLTPAYLARFSAVLPAPILAQLEAVCQQQQTRADLRRQAVQTIVKETNQVRANLRQIAGDPFFQEAIFLSNPDLYNNSLQRYLNRSGEVNHSLERKLMAYIQRFCAKNDTASFFGPLNCGFLSDTQEESIIIRQKGEKYSQREVFMSYWAVKLLADYMSQLESIQPFLQPRLHPLCHWEGKTIYFPAYARRIHLTEQQQAILAQVNGQRSISDIATAVRLPLSDVITMMARFKASKVVLCQLKLPSTIFHPLNNLIDQIKNLPHSWADRKYWLDELCQLEHRRQQFVKANLAERRQLLVQLDAHFTRLTGLPPRRGAGKTYADRTLIYEDCAGTYEQFSFSQSFFDDFRCRLRPILDLCAAHASLLQQHYRALGQQIFQAMSPENTPVPYAVFITAVQQQKNLPPTNAALDQFYNALYDLVAKRSDGHVARLTATDLNHLLTPIEMPTNCHISPDVMLAAPNLEAVSQGDYQVVLGEVHQVIYVWGSQLYFYPQQKQAEAEIAHHIAQMPAYEGLATILNERQHKGLLYQAFPGTWIEILAHPTDETNKRIPLKFLQVALIDDELTLQDTRTGQTYTLYTAGDEQLHLWSLAVPRAMPVPVHLGRHTPRIEFEGAVYAREHWLLLREDWGGDFLRLSGFNLFVRAQQIREKFQLPPRLFLHAASEPKPYYIDFANHYSLLLIQKLLQVNQQIRLTEMLPDYDQLWLEEQEEHFCCEFRMTACHY